MQLAFGVGLREYRSSTQFSSVLVASVTCQSHCPIVSNYVVARCGSGVRLMVIGVWIPLSALWDRGMISVARRSGGRASPVRENDPKEPNLGATKNLVSIRQLHDLGKITLGSSYFLSFEATNSLWYSSVSVYELLFSSDCCITFWRLDLFALFSEGKLCNV